MCYIIIQLSWIEVELLSSSFQRKCAPSSHRRHGNRAGIVVGLRPIAQTILRRICTFVYIGSFWRVRRGPYMTGPPQTIPFSTCSYAISYQNADRHWSTVRGSPTFSPRFSAIRPMDYLQRICSCGTICALGSIIWGEGGNSNFLKSLQ